LRDFDRFGGGEWRFDDETFTDAIYGAESEDEKWITKFPEGFDPEARGMKVAM